MLASLYSVVSQKMWTRRNFSSVEHLSPAPTASVAANSYVYCSSPCPCTSTVILSSAAETHSHCCTDFQPQKTNCSFKHSSNAQSAVFLLHSPLVHSSVCSWSPLVGLHSFINLLLSRYDLFMIFGRSLLSHYYVPGTVRPVVGVVCGCGEWGTQQPQP